MPKIVKSMKGSLVDFDLLKIKQEIASTPSPIEVSERKSFIDNKLQRRIRRAKDEISKAKDSKNETISKNEELRNGLVDLPEESDETRPVKKRKIKKV